MQLHFPLEQLTTLDVGQTPKNQKGSSRGPLLKRREMSQGGRSEKYRLERWRSQLGGRGKVCAQHLALKHLPSFQVEQDRMQGKPNRQTLKNKLKFASVLHCWGDKGRSQDSPWDESSQPPWHCWEVCFTYVRFEGSVLVSHCHCHRLYYLVVLGYQKSEMGLSGLKSRCWKG